VPGSFGDIGRMVSSDWIIANCCKEKKREFAGDCGDIATDDGNRAPPVLRAPEKLGAKRQAL
jgi:hypothetical protein